MINYTTTKKIISSIKSEKFLLNSMLTTQNLLNNKILLFIRELIKENNITVLSNISEKNLDEISQSSKILNKSVRNITLINTLLNQLEKIENFCTNKNLKTAKEQSEIYNTKYDEYFTNICNNTNTIENYISDFIIDDISDDLNKEEEDLNENTSALNTESCEYNECIKNDSDSIPFPENTLTISETQKKVILPFKLNDINKLLEENENSKLKFEEIINKYYTKPIEFYKYSALSRFKEAYSLMRKKEKSSIYQAFSLASEMFFNYNLHPAIITACHSLNELDIYLACLETNSLEDFHFFDIHYDMPPSVIQTI